MENVELFTDLAIALAIGLLIGVERGWSARSQPPGHRVAGFRTFGLLGLLGGVAGLSFEAGQPALATILLLAAAVALVAGYVRDMVQDGNVSATTTIAGLITTALGVMATTGLPVVAAASAGVMLGLLAMREQLHRLVRGLTDVEVKAVARFALISVVVLPLLPDQQYGPYDAWNPRTIWMVVVLISGFSFVGYIANKRFGEVKGTLATAAAGAIVSSTAVTAALSQKLAVGDEPAPLVAGIALAGVVMMVRVLILVTILADFVLAGLALTVVPAAIVSALCAAWALRGGSKSSGTPALIEARNPFDLVPALGFGALIAVAALFARWASEQFGNEGLGVVLAITGAFDVDAAIVTLGGLPNGTVTPHLAAIVLTIPILLNTLFKAVIVIGTAGWSKGRAAAAPLVLSFAASAVALAVLAIQQPI